MWWKQCKNLLNVKILTSSFGRHHCWTNKRIFFLITFISSLLCNEPISSSLRCNRRNFKWIPSSVFITLSLNTFYNSYFTEDWQCKWEKLILKITVNAMLTITLFTRARRTLKRWESKERKFFKYFVQNNNNHSTCNKGNWTTKLNSSILFCICNYLVSASYIVENEESLNFTTVSSCK